MQLKLTLKNKEMVLYKKLSSVLIASYLLGALTLAQDLKKEVHVVSQFKPEVEQADRISKLPTSTDTVHTKPEVHYSLLPSKVDTDFDPRAIKAATMVGTPLDKLYNSQIKMGIGNYTSPLLEFSIHNLRSKEYLVGAELVHRSSFSKIKLDNGDKVPAGYAKNRIHLHGKRFYNNVNLFGNVDLSSNRYRLYGYNTGLFVDSVPDIDKKDIKRTYTSAGYRFGIESTVADSSQPQYRILFGGNHLTDNHSNKDNNIYVVGKLGVMVKSFDVDLGVRYDYFGTNEERWGYNNSLLETKLLVGKSTSVWELKLGAKGIYDKGEKESFLLIPEARFNFQVIDNLLKTYFGVTGYTEANNMAKISFENPFILEGLYVQNTKHKVIGYGGLNGKLSRQAGFNAEVRFDVMEDAHFYVNDTVSELQNQFDVVYDDVDLIHLMGEAYYYPLDYLGLILQANVYNYKMAAEAEAWHKPNFDMSFMLAYNFKQKIYAKVDLNYIGKRYAKNWGNLSAPLELDPYVDLNLRLEYKYSNILSAFADFYNIAAQKKQSWNQYPNQGFNALVGFSYKF